MINEPGSGKSRVRPLDGAQRLYAELTAARQERKKSFNSYIVAHKRAMALEIAFALYIAGTRKTRGQKEQGGKP